MCSSTMLIPSMPFVVVRGIRDLEAHESEFLCPVQVVRRAIHKGLVAAGAADQRVDRLPKQLSLQVPQGEVDSGLRDRGDATGAKALGRPPHEVVQELERQAVAAFQERTEVVVDQGGRRLTEAALAQAPRPIFGRHLNPYPFPGVGAGHAAVETGELRVLIDGQRAPRVRVPAGTARLRGRGCSRDVQTDGSDLGYSHGGSLSGSRRGFGGASPRRLGRLMVGDLWAKYIALGFD